MRGVGSDKENVVLSSPLPFRVFYLLCVVSSGTRTGWLPLKRELLFPRLSEGEGKGGGWSGLRPVKKSDFERTRSVLCDARVAQTLQGKGDREAQKYKVGLYFRSAEDESKGLRRVGSAGGFRVDVFRLGVRGRGGREPRTRVYTPRQTELGEDPGHRLDRTRSQGRGKGPGESGRDGPTRGSVDQDVTGRYGREAGGPGHDGPARGAGDQDVTDRPGGRGRTQEGEGTSEVRHGSLSTRAAGSAEW